MAFKQTYFCANSNCREAFQAKPADRARGWALYCSKSCKATKQAEIKGATHSRHHQFSALRLRRFSEHDEGMEAMEAGWDGHKNAF